MSNAKGNFDPKHESELYHEKKGGHFKRDA